MSSSDIQIIGWVVIGALVIGFMAYRQLLKVQYVNPAKLWTIPALLAIWNVINLQHSFNDPTTMAVAAGVFGLGLAIGLVRGCINRVSFDPQSSQLVVYGSLTGMLVWLAGLAISIGMRVVFYNSPLGEIASPVMVLGIFIGWRLVWQIKYSRMFPGSRLY